MTLLHRLLLGAALAAVAPAGLTFAVSGLYSPPRLSGLAGGADPVAGRAIFQRTCARCHTLDGSTATGPSLRDIGLIAETRRPGLSAAEYLMESVVQPEAFRPEGAVAEMPRVALGLDDQSLRDVVAFLASQGNKPDLAAIARLPIVRSEGPPVPRPNAEQVRRGEALFLGQAGCVSCHHRLSRIAPPLEGAGGAGHDYLRRSIIEPDHAIAAAWRTHLVELSRGEILSGRLISDRPEELTLLSHTPQGPIRRTVPRDEVERVVLSERSSMPSFATVLTESQIDDLVAFLAAVR